MWVRIKPWVATLVFGILVGIVYPLVWFAMNLNSDPTVKRVYHRDDLVLLTICGLLVASLCGRYILSSFRYASTIRAMVIGSLVALISHLPFSIFLSVTIPMLEGTPMKLEMMMESLLLILFVGWLMAGIPLLISGAIAGSLCYHFSRRRSPTNE